MREDSEGCKLASQLWCTSTLARSFFCSKALLYAEQLAPSPTLQFPALKFGPAYFANLCERPRYVRALYPMKANKLERELEETHTSKSKFSPV